MGAPFKKETVGDLPPLPADLSSVGPGQYVVKYETSQGVMAEDGVIQAAIWFRLPPVTSSIFRRIRFLQLFAESRDQGSVSDEEAGTWTWFELAILEDEKSETPRVKDNVEYVWKSHLNPMKTMDYKWAGNVIAIRIAARFRGWALLARTGYLAVEIDKEPAKLEAPRFGKFEYIQNALQELNDKNETKFSYEATPVRADGFDADRERSLRVLSLDGGGVRGLSSLYILRDVMRRLGTNDEPAKPCDIFDMIAGTSTGGLCAIMLGRLRMSVDDCIKAYNEFMEQVFGAGWWNKVKGVFGTKYDASKLEKAMKTVIEKYAKNVDEPLLDEYSSCKVFVLSIREDAVNNTQPVFLRSYTNTQQPSLLPNIKIWEAARATSAAPKYFAPMEVNGYKLLDGGLGANNPIGWLWNEVLSVYGAGRPISCFLSIGTGIPKKRSMGGLWNLPFSLAAAATNSEITHILFRTLLDAYAPEVLQEKYWRLNVGREIPAWGEDAKVVDNEEVPDLDGIKDIKEFLKKTELYIKEQDDLIESCVDTIKPRRRTDAQQEVQTD
ncbi:acyl transferase/acyl hydrolase/lysophospholipase [Aspergillus transmontanensis]|uniref:Acyl transferase/acyl hydrolase/lysophospholipase n=1 Tax=Aspergillus transmontanensis TaxID=1034304 RepID=A0A5N6W7L5_9EURO|nr:acyl transferase/acyl hydrolase/lysophospholipase [Aspergillus transmontanensis]